MTNSKKLHLDSWRTNLESYLDLVFSSFLFRQVFLVLLLRGEMEPVSVGRTKQVTEHMHQVRESNDNQACRS